MTGMHLTFVRPRRELQPYVQTLWVFESPTGLPAADANLAAPNGCGKLTFAYGNPFESIANGKTLHRPPHHLNFVGIRDSPVLLRSSHGQIGCIGVEFYAHGVYPLFGGSMDETVNLLGDADLVLGRWASEVQTRLNDFGTTGERVAYLQRALFRRLSSRKATPQEALVAHCVHTLRAAHGLVRVRALEHQTGYTRRYLDALFKRHVGLSPKALAGIFRFQRFYREWARGRSFDLLKNELYEYYYDQSHFTKEFKRMTGYTPREYSHECINGFGRLVSAR